MKLGISSWGDNNAPQPYNPHPQIRSLSPSAPQWRFIQSINQSNFYSANTPGEARLSSVTNILNVADSMNKFPSRKGQCEV